MSRAPNTGDGSREPKPRVLIGSLTRDNKGAIPTITRALIDGLEDRYEFVPHYSNRRFGLTATAEVNILNLFYFMVHLVQWLFLLLRARPAVVHYPVTSQWNLEKSAAFLLAGRLVRAHTVGHLNGGSFDAFWNRLGMLRRGLGTWCLKGLDAFVVTGERWKQWSVNTAGLDPHRVHVVTNLIDRHFEAEALSFPPAGNADAFFMGSLGTRKGVYDILETARHLRTSGDEGRIYLSGPEDRTGDLARITDSIARDDLRNVTLLGPLYGAEKLEYFRQHAIFLFPSHNENFPLVVLEAAAAGKAIITTPVGALPEFFTHGEHLLFVQPGDVRGIASAIASLRSDPALRRRLGESARRVFVSRLGKSCVFASMDAVYRRVLEMS